MRRPTAVAMASVILCAALSGCFVRGNVVYAVQDPSPGTWTPAAILADAIVAGGGDPERTTILEYAVTFTQQGHLRIVDLRVITAADAGSEPFFLDYLVGSDYDAAADTVTFNGVAHQELSVGERTDPANEWDLNRTLLDRLGRYTFLSLAEAAGYSAANSTVIEYRITSSCRPLATSDGPWTLLEARSQGLVSQGGGYTPQCAARPTLPPVASLSLHTPCIRGPSCSDGVASHAMIDYAVA